MRGLYELPLSRFPQTVSIGISGNPDDLLHMVSAGGSLADAPGLPVWMRDGRTALYEGPRLIGYVTTLQPITEDEDPFSTSGRPTVVHQIRGYEIEFVRAIGPAP